MDASGRRNECPHLAPAHIASTAELDTLELAGTCPPPDGRWRKMDIRGSEDLGRLRQGDPVRGAGHRQSAFGPAGAGSFLGVVDGLASVSFFALPSVEVPLSPLEPLEPPSLLSLLEPLSPAAVALRDLALELRSFFAHPDPLKWTAGALMALRIGPPPHSGQLLGSSAWTPCITSNRRPQFAQS